MTGLQLTGTHVEAWQEGATHTTGLQLTGTQQGTWHRTGTHTVAGRQVTGTQQAGGQPEEQLEWHMAAVAGWRGEAGVRLTEPPPPPGLLYPGLAAGRWGSCRLSSSWLFAQPPNHLLAWDALAHAQPRRINSVAWRSVSL